MFGLGLSEIAVILLVALLLIRPRDLPGLLRRVGRGCGELAQWRENAVRIARDLESELAFDAERSKGSGDGNGRADEERLKADDQQKSPPRRWEDPTAKLYRDLTESRQPDERKPTDPKRDRQS